MDSRWDEGDVEGAIQASKSAKRWSVAAIVISAMMYVLIIVKAFMLLLLKFNLFETVINAVKDMVQNV